MRCLVCALAPPDFLRPLVGLARELDERGHEVCFVTADIARGFLDSYGLAAAVAGWPSAPGLFHLNPTVVAELVAAEAEHLVSIGARFAPDVVVANQLAFAAFAAAHRLSIPLYVLDAGAYRPDWSDMTPIESLGRHLSVPAFTDGKGANVLAGDCLMVPSVPALHPMPLVSVPARAVGALALVSLEHEHDREILPPPSGDPPLVYAVGRRVEHEADYIRALVEGGADLDVRVVVSRARWDRPVPEMPGNAAVAEGRLSGAHLDQASLVVAPARDPVIVHALARGRPAIAVRKRGGDMSPWLNGLIASGAVRAISPDQQSPEKLRCMLQGALSDGEMRRRAEEISRHFAPVDGFGPAARTVEEAVRHGARRRAATFFGSTKLQTQDRDR